MILSVEEKEKEERKITQQQNQEILAESRARAPTANISSKSKLYHWKQKRFNQPNRKRNPYKLTPLWTSDNNLMMSHNHSYLRKSDEARKSLLNPESWKKWKLKSGSFVWK